MDKIKIIITRFLIITGILTGIISLPVSGMAQNYNQPNPFTPDTTLNKNTQSQNMPYQSGLSKGNWALMFQIDQNFTLKDFSGTLISLQRNLSNGNAIRLGLGLNGGYNSQKNSPTQKTTTGKFHLGVSLNYLWYLHAYRKVRFYYGLGPLIAFGYNHTKNSQNSGANITKQINFSEEVGLEGVAGVEWFVTPRIGLLAEYVPTLTSKYQSAVTKTYTGALSARSKTSSTDIHLGYMPVRFGVSVYF